MSNVFISFAIQLILLNLSITAFVLIGLLLGAVRARRLREERELREAERRQAEARRERRPIGSRPAVPARILQPPASLAPVPIHRKSARPVLGQRMIVFSEASRA